ncbi:MAG: RNA polymerase subunit sigma [Actinobacteria bacterium HGW-Actinobacteria-4]|nr:MAG: RNA polymerase subunit sigma [Actinobacteria bacterium HGW-Actinobacteria-4]
MPPRDAEALRALHDQHAAVIWRYAVRLTGTTTHADDVVQETLLRAWRTPRILHDDPGTTRSWMFTVARNIVIDEARSARSRRESPTEHLPERPTDDATSNLFDSLLVAEALQALTPDHHAVVTRAYFGGLTTAELATELGIAEGTVKSRLHYGLRALRLALQEKGVTR